MRSYQEEIEWMLPQTLEVDVAHGDGSPAWEASVDNLLCRTAVSVFKEVWGVEPSIKAIHAVLECGVIQAKKPGMNAISTGPNVNYGHSTKECVEIESVNRFWGAMKKLHERLATDLRNNPTTPKLT